MCEADPGPRCSYDMSKKLTARKEAWNKTVKKFGEDSPESLLAKAKVATAQLEYETTPEGIKNLVKLNEDFPDNKEIHKRLIRARTMRQMQTAALNEIKINRPNLLAQVYSETTGFFDSNEIETIILNSREVTENRVLSNALQNVNEPELNPVTSEEYNSYLRSLRDTVSSTESIQSLKTLEKQPLPDRVNFIAYTNILQSVAHSKTQLLEQLKETAALQNTSLSSIQSYYEAYRNQYMTQYSHLPAKDQPNPPDNWVKGEFNHSGYSKSKSSNYAPRDNASLYALYRLQNDDEAIPDYMKQNKQFLSIHQNNGQIISTTYSLEGKKIKDITVPGTPQGMLKVYQEMEGKILLTVGDEKDRMSSSHINVSNFFSKYLDFPRYDPAYVRAQMKVTDPRESFFQARRKVKQMWKSKSSRASAPPVEPVKNNRWT